MSPTANEKTKGETKEGLAPGKPLSLVEAIEYSPGSVVSKTLVKKEVGTVTLFAFDQGEGLSEHTAPFDALVQILDGAAVIQIDGKPIPVQTGEMILMPADVPHSLQATTRFKMMLVMIRSR